MTWTLNLALHRKVAARVRSSASGMQQADGADEVSKMIDAHRLILYRDAVAVATLQWGLPLVVDGEALASPGVPASATILDADIDSGTWTARLESLDGAYVATTTSVGTSGTDVVVADDLDDENGVSIAVNLLMDDDLSSGGAEPEPEPPSDIVMFPFKADSPWNAPIPGGATYYGSSDARTQEITRTSKPSIPGWTQMGETGGSIKWAVNAQNFAINVFYALPGGPTKTIRVKDMYGSRFDYDVTVPWPAGTHAAMGTDMHLSIIDADGITSHDFWHCQLQGNGDYIAASYSRTRLDGSGWNLFPYSMESPSNPHGRNPAEAVAGVGASRAVSVSCLGGLIRQADVQRGSIDHALAIAVPRTYIRRGPRVWPADPTSSYYDGDGRSTGPLAYSMRFAIPKSVNLNSLGLTANWLMVAKAMQDYGVYIVDVAGIFNPCIYTEYPAAFSFGSALRDASGGQDTHFPKLWSRLQYVDWA